MRRLPLPPADGAPSALLRPAPFREHSNRVPGTRTACERNGSVRTLVPCRLTAGWGANECAGELALPYGYAGAMPGLNRWAMDRQGEMVRSAVRRRPPGRPEARR